MECPHCKYTVDDEKEYEVHGNFWRLQGDLELRRQILLDEEKAYLRGCPKCKKLFVSDYNW